VEVGRMGYEWYEEDITSFILKYDLPAYNRKYEIKRYYNLQMGQFLSDFDLMIKRKQNRAHTDDFYNKLQCIKPTIKKTFKKIFDVLTYYDKLEFKQAQDLFDELMEMLFPCLFITTINGMEKYNPRLYRIRSIKGGEKWKGPSDLFHIPYTKRNLITNERFSLAGHPCLYLATDLGIAWEECGYPSQFYYSQFEYEPYLRDDWKFITLISPRKFSHAYLIAIKKEEEDSLLKSICQYLTTYPLILACSIVNLSGDSVFKPEYILPQMLLQWVYRNYDRVHGITYFSCIATDDLRRVNGYNIVIPAHRINRKGYGGNLTEKFRISKPVFCDNMLPDGDRKRIASFKSDLRQNFNHFPFTTMECVTMMYETCLSFDILLSKAKETNMKLVVSSVQSIKKNCSFIPSRSRKQEIIEAAMKENPFDDKKSKIDNFGFFFDRFWADVEPIISQYDLKLQKTIVPEATQYFSL
jgi:hypothetical protein